MSRSFLPDWLAAAAAADTATAHIPRRADRHERLKASTATPIKAAAAVAKAKTPPKARVARPAPTPNPQLAEALARIKSEAVRAVPVRAPSPSPSPPISSDAEAEPPGDPEAVVARLIGRGLQPLDADVPVLAAARRRAAGEARIVVPEPATARRPVPAARLARPRKRSLGARFNDATPSFLDSEDDDGADADRGGASSSPSAAAPGRKMFRKVTTLANADVIALAGTVPSLSPSPSPSPSPPPSPSLPPSYQPPPPPPRAATPPPPPRTRARRARDLLDDVAPDLSPLAPARSPTPPPPVVASFYRYEPSVASDDACASPPSLSPDVTARVASRSPSLLAPLPEPVPTADESASDDAFARFEPAFLRRDFLP